MDGPVDTLVYRRVIDDEHCVVAIHFGKSGGGGGGGGTGEARLELDGRYRVLVSSDGEREGEEFDGTLRADSAVVLTLRRMP
jgi:hypothetical protein